MNSGVLAIVSSVIIVVLSYALGNSNGKKKAKENVLNGIYKANKARESLRDDSKLDELCKKYNR